MCEKGTHVNPSKSCSRATLCKNSLAHHFDFHSSRTLHDYRIAINIHNYLQSNWFWNFWRPHRCRWICCLDDSLWFFRFDCPWLQFFTCIQVAISKNFVLGNRPNLLLMFFFLEVGKLIGQVYIVATRVVCRSSWSSNRESDMTYPRFRYCRESRADEMALDRVDFLFRWRLFFTRENTNS